MADSSCPGTRPLLEREHELAVIDELIGDARRGRGRALILQGPLGVGKSSLVWAAVAAARRAGCRTLTARASEFERDIGFGAVRQLFEPVIAESSAAERQALFDGPAEFAESVLVGAAPARSTGAADARYAALHALYWLTVHLAEQTPIVLAVDDVQWADAASLRFLDFLERRLDGLTTLMVLAVRSGETAADADALDALLNSGHARLERPRPLTAVSTAALVRDAVPAAADPELPETLHVATQGNPYFLRELLVALRAAGPRPSVADARRVIAQAAPGVARMIVRRVRQLPLPAREFAEAAAVLGDGSTPSMVATVAGLTGGESAAAQRSLAAAELLSIDAAVRFTHPLIRSAIRGSLEPDRRAELQTAAARHLATAGQLEKAAEHLLAVAPAGAPWVAETLASAGTTAVARRVPEVALTLWHRALAEPPAPERRTQLLLSTGALESELGHPQAVTTLREALSAAPDARARVHVARELAEALLRATDTRGMADVLEQAINEAASFDTRLAEELEAQLLLFGPWDPMLRTELAPRLGRLGSPGAGQGAQPVRLTVVALEGLHKARAANEVAAAAQRALSAGALLARDTWMAAAGFVAVNVLALAGQPDEAARYMERAMVRDRARMAIGALRTGAGLRGRVAFLRGDMLAAEAEARAVFDLAPEGELGPPGLLDLLLEVLLERGQGELAQDELERAGFAGELPRFLPLNRLLYVRGRLHIARGELRSGVAELLACGDRCETAGQHNPAVVPWRSRAALTLAALGEDREARRLAGDEVELATRFGAPHVVGPALRALAIVTDGPDRLVLLRRAVATLEASFARLEFARALADLGAALTEDGAAQEARDMLTRALELATRLGADALAEQILPRLIAAGGRPRRAAQHGPAALTPSERRVADLAAGGLTNRQVAQQLFLSEKTIETHLASAYRKLSIRGRVQLARALDEVSVHVRE